MLHVLVIGGGFGGLRVVHELQRAKFPGQITLVDRKSYFEVTYATLRTLSNPEFANGTQRKAYSEFLEAKFVQDEVTALNSHSAVLASGQEIELDYAVIATGTSYPSLPAAKSESALSTADREGEIATHHAQLESYEHIKIVGAGAVGTELAAEIKAHYPEKSIQLLDLGDRVLSHLQPKASAKALQMLQQLNVDVQLNTKAERSELESDQPSHHTYWCGGPKVQTGFIQGTNARLDSGLLVVDPHLRVSGHNNWFAVGDVVDLPDAKMGATASNQGQSVAGNLVRLSASKTRLKPYKPQPFMSIVPIGRTRGVAQIGRFVSTLKPVINFKQKDLLIGYAMSQIGAG